MFTGFSAAHTGVVDIQALRGADKKRDEDGRQPRLALLEPGSVLLRNLFCLSICHDLEQIILRLFFLVPLLFRDFTATPFLEFQKLEARLHPSTLLTKTVELSIGCPEIRVVGSRWLEFLRLVSDVTVEFFAVTLQLGSGPFSISWRPDFLPSCAARARRDGQASGRGTGG